MQRLGLCASVAVLLAACAAAPEPPAEDMPAAEVAEQPAAPKPALTEAELTGTWRIASLNGAPPLGRPRIVLGASGYGGNTGCNDFGGYAVFDGERYYGSPASQNLMGCPAVMAQEEAILRLFTSAPHVAKGDGSTLVLSGGGREMVLTRDPTDPAARAPDDPPPVLVGTRWTIREIDGERLPFESGRTLVFEADRWTVEGLCGAPSGSWRQQGGRILTKAEPTPPSEVCPAADRQFAERLGVMLAARPGFVTGPNGEILIGGGGHWLWGERPRQALADEAPLLGGRWRIVGIDGRPPAEGREAGLAFGPTGYSGGTGCNGMQGLYLAHGRRLFTGWGVQTQMGCGGPVGAQEKRIVALLGSGPRIGVAGGGEIALMDSEGSVRLRREPGGEAWGPDATAWAGQPLEGEVLFIDGEPTQMRSTEPEVRLRLTREGWELRSGCGRIGGIWRRREGVLEFLTDSDTKADGACAGILGKRFSALSRLGNGGVRGLVGPSGELLLAGAEHWIVARMRPPARRR
jgi:heat shock protein HslJ